MTRPLASRLLALAPVLLVGACQAAIPAVCPPGTLRMTEARLIFGRDIAGRGPVTDQEWQDFLTAEITPRFPDGLSVTDIAGQYRSPSGTLVREQSKSLTLYLQSSPDDQTKLAALRDLYKSRFRQDSVLLTLTPICAGF
jgi:Protein of unknown function (DUF3574)